MEAPATDETARSLTVPPAATGRAWLTALGVIELIVPLHVLAASLQVPLQL